MRKKIGYISLDLGLAKWLCEKLRVPGRTAPEMEEFAEALEELMSGSISSLMLELDGAPATPAVDSCLQFGALSVDPRLRRVSRNGVEISLTPKEFDILWFLASNCGEVFTKKTDLSGGLGRGLYAGRQQYYGVYPQTAEKDRTGPGCSGIYSDHLGNRLQVQ